MKRASKKHNSIKQKNHQWLHIPGVRTITLKMKATLLILISNPMGLTVWKTFFYNKETTWKGKYQSTDNTKIMKRKGKLLPKNEEISKQKAHTNTRKLN